MLPDPTYTDKSVANSSELLCGVAGKSPARGIGVSPKQLPSRPVRDEAGGAGVGGATRESLDTH